MGIRITKTSKQAQLECTEDNICPECGKPAIGIISEELKLFHWRKKHQYSCFYCGCEWETDWIKS